MPSQICDNFQPISMGSMPNNIQDWEVRHDQNYLYRMVLAINNGICDQNLANEKPGPVSKMAYNSIQM